jgi:hypothetical protein
MKCEKCLDHPWKPTMCKMVAKWLALQVVFDVYVYNTKKSHFIV